MAATRPDVVIQKGTWTNVYVASTIMPGTAVTVYNKGPNRCYLAISPTQPAVPSTGAVPFGVPLHSGSVGSFANVGAGDTGLWVYSPFGTTILVQD